jgi:hypothetical protein
MTEPTARRNRHAAVAHAPRADFSSIGDLHGPKPLADAIRTLVQAFVLAPQLELQIVNTK